MLKKIPTSEAKLGMFLQSLEGSWLSHPFWKTRFVLADEADLAALKASGVPAVWIDVSKGCDADAPVPAGAAAPAEAVVAIASTAPTPVAVRECEPRVGFEEEVGRAAEVLHRSRQAVTALFNEARLGKAIDTEVCLPIVEEVASSLARNPSAFISLARLKTRDDYTYMHSVAVCGLMVALARHMGMGDDEAREAGLAGLLHDVGKMQMPLDVLNKPGALTDAEFSVMRSHPERGWELLKEGAKVPAAALDVCLHHHEKIDGTGYPHKLAGEQISLLARMGAVCDVYDAITSTRPYKNAWDPAGSLQRMAQWKGQFDPAIFQAFVKSVGIYPTGTLVRLQSGRLGVVVDQNPASLVAPRVKVFFSTKSNMPIPVQLLDLAAPGTPDRIAGREPPESWGFNHLEEFWNPKK
ncbi:HD-GYP domain-containing protein [Roseateles saccharophilus]|uniref:Putative nucleotidyltransferase with HDIG domain n=1 Tax=Roseateles saccharophilus TaxID=304 RepID=A0A4R3USY3_ROSSA|nr:HD-GYP domain-containing protein [Roseateles saccharophilus]MDG0833367.1 HD-GYP domain-containing protein [Roseateles saccharophilus]TCU93817.1 putative nucleotidyltransferase with HDIG domain [Roseateles saccharophilus]